MAARKYSYGGKTWIHSPTYSDGNCFFHAVFGEKYELDGSEFYIDRHAHFRRLYWAAFLSYFQSTEMSQTLLDTIHKCFVASDSFQGKCPKNSEAFYDYIRNVSVSQYWVLAEEIPVLSTLFNVKVVLFLGEQETPGIFEPNHEIFGSFPFRIFLPLREEVIRLADHHFERLSTASEPINSVADQPKTNYQYEDDSDEELDDIINNHKKHYKRGGSAGVQGGLYQVSVIAMALLNALKKRKTLMLSTENHQAGKFDDLVLETPEGDVLIQAKHKEDKKKIINYDALLSTTSSPFSLAKYFLSFQEIRTNFKIRNIVICTNVDLQTDKRMKGLVEHRKVTEDDLLHFKGAPNTFYTFNEGLVSDLKHSIIKYHAQNTPRTKACISEDDIKEFLSHLQFYPNFITEDDTGKIVEDLIPSLTLAKGLDTKDTFNYVHAVVLDWFTNRNSDGRYLSRLEAKAMLCDNRTTRYCQRFQIYDISFKNDILSVARDESMRILHVVPAGEWILSIVSLARSLQEKEKVKALFVDPTDTMDVQKKVIDGFAHPRYTHLVIASPNWKKDDALEKICNKIVKILDAFQYKKVIVVADPENKLAKRMKSSNSDSYREIREEMRFRDLTEEAQDILKKRKNIVFQGTLMTLEELVVEDLDSFVDSELLEKLSKNDIIEIGSKPVHVDRNIDNYYIYRTLTRNDENIPEEMFRLLEDFQERIVLISDTAGMGKTTILTNLAVKVKKNYPSLWVVCIDLNNQSGAFKVAVRDRKSISVMDLLEAQESTKLTQKLFLKPNNVVLMLDAVDEVSSRYMNLVMTMLAEVKEKKNFVKIFVTTRPHLCEALQHKLGVTAFTMEPFSRDDQVDFLKKYWSQRLGLEDAEEKRRCQQYAEALIDEMARWIGEASENTFAGIPLQTRMLAEVFQERNQLEDDEPKQWEECKEFLNSGKDEPHLPKRINLIQLYELFMTKKRDIFVDVKGNTGGNHISEDALQDKFEECHEFHRNLAIRILFFPNQYEILGSYKKWEDFSPLFVDNYVLRAGIVQQVDGKVNFIHRTFAEYFVAECLVLDLKNGCASEKFREFLLEEILIREDYLVVRAFFDSFVQKELPSIPKVTLTAFCETDYLSVLDNGRKSYLHLLAKEGSVGTMEFLFACTHSRIRDDDEVSEEVKGTFVDATDLELNTPLHVASSRGHLNVVTSLIENGANVNFGNMNEETPLHVAALGGHLEVVEYLVCEAGADLNKVNSYGESALLLATRKGNLEIIKFLVGKGVSYIGVYTTALHIAASLNKLHIVQYLLEEANAGVDVLDVDNCTPLHDASHEGHLTVVEYLVRRGSNVNATNRALNTAFHAAALRGYLYLAEYFVLNGADGTIVNTDGYTIGGLIDWLRSLLKKDTESDERSSNAESGIRDNEIEG